MIGFPPVRFISIKPSADSAHFKVMYGRLSVLNVMKRLIRCRHSSSKTPTVTSMPALRSFSMPLPATWENGSMQPITTLGISLLYNQVGAGRGFSIMGAWLQTYVYG